MIMAWKFTAKIGKVSKSLTSFTVESSSSW